MRRRARSVNNSYLRPVASGQCDRLSELPRALKNVLVSARRAVMTTVDSEGRPHAVPVVFAIYGDDLVTPIDRKPKSGRKLARIRNLERNPNVTLLADKWAEDWKEAAWVMIRGRGIVQPAESARRELEAIIARYPDYRDVLENSQVIRIVPERILWWSWS